MSKCSECGRKDCCGSWMEEDYENKIKRLVDIIDVLQGNFELAIDLSNSKEVVEFSKASLSNLKGKLSEGG